MWLCLFIGAGIVAVQFMPHGGSIIVPVPVTPQPGSWVVCVRESSTPNIDLDILIASDLRDSLTAKGLKFRVFDKDAPEAKSQYLPIIQGKGLSIPAWVVISPSGAVLGAFPFESRAKLEQQIKSVTGL